MHWKVRLEGDESVISKFAQSGNATAHISRDGIEWFLESTDFESLSDPVEVKDKATQIVAALNGGTGVTLGPVYRIHYDNSKSVYR